MYDDNGTVDEEEAEGRIQQYYSINPLNPVIHTFALISLYSHSHAVLHSSPPLMYTCHIVTLISCAYVLCWYPGKVSDEEII